MIVLFTLCSCARGKATDCHIIMHVLGCNIALSPGSSLLLRREGPGDKASTWHTSLTWATGMQLIAGNET